MKTAEQIIEKINSRLTDLIYAVKMGQKNKEHNYFVDAKAQELLKLLDWIKEDESIETPV